MKKNKILIYICCFLFMFVSCISFTYCSFVPDKFYTIQRLLPTDSSLSSNFYNGQNLNYVNLTNFDFNRELGRVLYFTTDSYISELSNIPEYTETQDIYYNYYGDKIKIGSISQTYVFEYSSNIFLCNLTNFSFSPLSDYICPLGISSLDSYNIEIQISSLPISYLMHYVYNVQVFKSLYLYSPISISFDFDFNQQYYYNDLFGITLGNIQPFEYNFIETNDWINNYQQTFIISDDNNNEFKFTDTNYDLNNSQPRVFLLNNNFNYDSVIYKNVFYHNFYRNNQVGDVDLSTFIDNNYSKTYFYFNHSASEYVENDNSSTLYSINSKHIDNLNSPLIPLSSSKYYKSAEWWDIPSHLYNFFIYLIFDAPIISNFTNLVMIIINFIVEVFEFFIGLFNGINNIFFISIFLGIIILIFLLKIIFKG